MTDGADDSSPAVVDGVAYDDSFDRDLYVLNAATGALQWRYRTVGVVLSSPAVADGKVFFASSDGHVYARMAIAAFPNRLHYFTQA